jgi:phage repressor protein C with HTH and peptisase S24 domain
MQLVAAIGQRRPRCGMPQQDSAAPPDERETIARALRSLRARAGLTMDQAAANLGVTRQGWQVYERGDRRSLLNSDTQARLAAALGASREELLTEAARQPGGRPAAVQEAEADTHDRNRRRFEIPVWARVRAGSRAPFAHDLGEPAQVLNMEWMFGPETGALRVVGDSMTGYVESDQLVIFDRTRWPRRNEGCVVETKDGELYVKEYLRSDGSNLFVQQRFPEETITFPMSEVKGVYKVRLRGD